MEAWILRIDKENRINYIVTIMKTVCYRLILKKNKKQNDKQNLL